MRACINLKPLKIAPHRSITYTKPIRCFKCFHFFIRFSLKMASATTTRHDSDSDNNTRTTNDRKLMRSGKKSIRSKHTHTHMGMWCVYARKASSNWRDFTLRQIQILKTPIRWPYGDKLVFAIYCSFTPCAYPTITLLAIEIETRFLRNFVTNLRYLR